MTCGVAGCGCNDPVPLTPEALTDILDSRDRGSRRDRFICAALTGLLAGMSPQTFDESKRGSDWGKLWKALTSAAVGLADATLAEADKVRS